MQSTSFESPPESTIIRTGSDGRLRYSQQQRREMLTAFERSGQSAMAFCRQHGVAYQTFIAWLVSGVRSAVGCALTGCVHSGHIADIYDRYDITLL